MKRPLEERTVAQPSLAYYDRIFGHVRGPAFWELVDALAEELDEYANAVTGATLDGPTAAALRHAHQPLVQNLGLGTLAEAEQRLKAAVDAPGASAARESAEALASVARQTAQTLRDQSASVTSGPLPSDPGPR